MTTYNHAYDIAFEISGSTDPDGEDVTPAIMKAALLKRIESMDKDNIWFEAVGCPFDTYEEE